MIKNSTIKWHKIEKKQPKITEKLSKTDKKKKKKKMQSKTVEKSRETGTN